MLQLEKHKILAAEAEALTAISELGYKKAKLAETKVAQEEFKKQQEAKPKPEVNLKQQPASHRIT